MALESGVLNRVKSNRMARGWSQAELAQRAGISRTAVSAIEGQHLVPSVATAMALARVFECAVEELFGPQRDRTTQRRWAWKPPRPIWRYWQAEVGGQALLFPVESAAATAGLPHDGAGDDLGHPPASSPLARQTLVVACCDPAVGLLSTLYTRMSGFRMIAIPRSSQSSLDLLAQGLIHVAGLHLSIAGEDRNATAVQTKLGDGYRLLRVACWQEGLAVATGKGSHSVKSVIQSRLRWVGREAGSGARQCMDEILPDRITIRHIAHDHRGVADAIRSGWADIGVCLRMTCEEAGLNFLSLRDEVFEFCFSRQAESDPRIQALLRVVRSIEYRRLIAELPGYETTHSGEVRTV